MIYASKGTLTAGPVPSISNLASPQSATDGSAALQALCDLNKSGNLYAGQQLEIVIDIPILCNQISLNSFTTIRGLGAGSQLVPGDPPPTGLWMKALPSSGAGSTNSCILRNANWISNYNASSPASSPLNCANIIDQDIYIHDLYLDGQRRNNVSGQGTASQNAATNYISPIQIFGCTNLRVERVNIYDPACYHQWYGNISYGTFRDIRVCDPVFFSGSFVSGRYTDGFHLSGPFNDILIDGLTGTAGDDFLALNAADGNLDSTADEATFFSFSTVYYGNGTRITARNLFPYQSFDVVRLLTGKDTVNSGTTACTIDQCQVTNAVGSVTRGGLQAQTFAGAGSGGVQNRATFRDWQITVLAQGAGAPYGNDIGGNWTDLTFSNIHYNDVQGSGNITHQINILSTAAIGRLLIDNYWIKEDSSENSSPATAISVVSGATIDELIIKDSGWNRYASTNLAFATISGGTVNRVSMSGVSCNNLANLLTITGGTVTQIDTSNICQRNPYTSVRRAARP